MPLSLLLRALCAYLSTLQLGRRGVQLNRFHQEAANGFPYGRRCHVGAHLERHGSRFPFEHFPQDDEWSGGLLSQGSTSGEARRQIDGGLLGGGRNVERARPPLHF